MRRMEKQEFLELCEAAILAARGISGDKKSPDVSRCIDAMNRLKGAPESLVVDVLMKTYIGNRFRDVLFEHKNSQIRSEARNIRDLWLMYFHATGREKSTTSRGIPVKMKRVEVVSSHDSAPMMMMMMKTGDINRDKVREVLRASLAKVATEVVTTELKKQVASCNPSVVAVSLESAMFENLGCFLGPQKAKYRSILFNMGDSKNPDLRRKVLIGDISGVKLVTMKTEELASDKIQIEVQRIKEKAILREDNRIKMFQSDMLIMT